VSYEFPIEAGHIMLFARAIGDANPIYSDAERAIAPPTFVQASAHYDPEYPLRPRIGERWFGSGATATGGRRRDAQADTDDEAGGTSLHAEQHFTYHRAIRPGDVLTVTTQEGRSWEKQGKRAGTLRFRELITEYRDQAGQLVVTARLVGVRTQRAVGDAST
jgi:acyl-CoA thioesterase FadM